MDKNNKFFYIRTKLEKITGIRFEENGRGFRFWRIRPLNMSELAQLDNIKHKAKKYRLEVS